jgi:hypothetical protein
MNKMTALSAIAFLAFLSCALANAQQSITIQGLDGNKLTYTVEQLRQLPQQSVSMANPHTKATGTFEGVLLIDLLHKAGAPGGDKLRGEELRDYVEVAGSDGYRVVFALAELDPGFQDNAVLVAISGDGKPLDDKQGPVRIVAPQDKRPARSVRMVTSITIRRVP